MKRSIFVTMRSVPLVESGSLFTCCVHALWAALRGRPNASDLVMNTDQEGNQISETFRNCWDWQRYRQRMQDPDYAAQHEKWRRQAKAPVEPNQREAREAAGIIQRVLVAAVGVYQTTVSKWEKSRRCPEIPVCARPSSLSSG